METDISSELQIPSMASRICPFFAPALLISMGYIDPGKWAAAIEGGARFGFDLVLLLFIFNLIAILCQSLAARIGMVTGRNLAQICEEEYTRPMRMFLGIQAELSLILQDLTMILGIALGLNLLLGLDLFKCLLFTTINDVSFPIIIALLGNQRAKMLCVYMAGFILFFFVYGVLTSQADGPFSSNGMVPKVKAESLYTLMSLLGASILPHNFYMHSTIVQQEEQQCRRSPNISLGTVCHYHFVAITIIFSGILLANYVLMSSAATVFHGAGLSVLTVQDALLLMDQIFRSSTARFTFFLVIFCASWITKLTCDIGGRSVFHGFLGRGLCKRVIIKAFTIIPALSCVWFYGAEGVYQFLIFSQVILGLQLPSAVIPLFRIASSSSIMGTYKIPLFIEIFSWTSFFGMLVLNIFFVLEMVFGDSDWIGNLRWNMGSNVALPYLILLVIGFTSISLMLWLAATPLKSANDRPDAQTWNLELQTFHGSSENLDQIMSDKLRNDRDEKPMDDMPPSEVVSDSIAKSSVVDEKAFSAQSIVEVDRSRPLDVNQSQPESLKLASKVSLQSDTASVSVPTIEKIDVDAGLEVKEKPMSVESQGPIPVTGEVEADLEIEKDDDDTDVWEHEDASGGASATTPTSMHEGPGSFRSFSGKSEDGGSGSGSLSRLSGLGRAARRQFAAVLDDFWGKLYDFHGQAIPEAKLKKIDQMLAGKPFINSGKMGNEAIGPEHSMYSPQEIDRGFDFLPMSMDSSPRQQLNQSNLEHSSYAALIGSPTWSSQIPPLDAYGMRSSFSTLDNERRYSSLRLPSYQENRDYQPATIHGCQAASFLNRTSMNKNMDPLAPLDTMARDPSSLLSSYTDSLAYAMGKNDLGSTHDSGMISMAMSTHLPSDSRPYYNPPSSIVSNDNSGSNSYAKKYHSLPDISGLGVSCWSQLATDTNNNPWSNSISPSLSIGGRTTSSIQPPYSHIRSRAERGPLAFDELSPSKLHREAFSLHSDQDTSNSLWSRQPFDQLYGRPSAPRALESQQRGTQHDVALYQATCEAEVLQSLRYCIMKLLRLESSEWLFSQSGGLDEELIDRVAARERFIYEAEARESSRAYAGDSRYLSADRRFGSRIDDSGLAQMLVSSVPNCGEGCIWTVSLVVSFGVWCIHRVLELSLMESRPELWGKYTYVLNRLQGILDPAFSKPRQVLAPCFCLQIPSIALRRPGHAITPNGQGSKGKCTSASMLLDLIKDVEAAVASRKGRTGTAAGDVAFPKGKENLASVLKRYKRRLSHKTPGTHHEALRKGLPPSLVP
ncbi:ethylene-insensitive protein 2 isoform X1 [Amborella trichopoda]|uniref:Ethylene-insensitive protein 2 n=1 Tax=Amborella trichopoda TaxID=13333 RepID=W1PK33_AMBTC|nr:ethylene-insensitive protein 2 isoform X1 [Amborella trichopoda]XP_020524318.1 ethylene-insensitive protein 2 isoform X1 [Amborella trichopoda]XP_020524319.1 ethylene-insensitive protein 2 isoform X1 [Amborella trichopoda]ERN08378.1 hypothetical protein AMTR_s00148p00061600 [Amborella trichopoda]|eukprot:XP_020524317.1 ethylene-insensitive protein 2 isoform X1 [Amborella trichopoda]